MPHMSVILIGPPLQVDANARRHRPTDNPCRQVNDKDENQIDICG